MRMAKVSAHKRSSTSHRAISNHQAMSDEDFHVHQDVVIEPNFSIGDPGELCLDKVENLLEIQTAAKTENQSCSSSDESGESASELIIRSTRRQTNKKKLSEEKQIALLASSIRGKANPRIPKVTLKLGVSSTGSSITIVNNTSSNNGPASISQLPNSTSSLIATTTVEHTGTNKSTMKSRSSARQLAAAAAAANGTASSNQQVSSGDPQTPRTPGTPSDHGTNTPNPPTPGNTNSSGMVSSSPHQYVTITVDGEGGLANEGGVSVGGSSSAYPVYSVGDSSAIYSAGSAQYYTGSSGTPGVTYTQEENGGEDGTTGALTTAEINSILSGGSGESSLMSNSNSPEADVMHQHHQALLDGGVYMVPASGTNNNNNSGTSEGEGPANLSHATRVSPTTRKRKRSIPPPEESGNATGKDLEEDDNEEEEDGGYDFQEGEDSSGDQINNQSASDGGINSLLSETEIRTLSKLYPMTSVNGFVGMSHASKMCPETVQWLLDNYETAEGVSLPRSTLYNHYLRHCSDNKLDPVNAASFGKLIRSVFLGLRTRRLGTRGNSKYHYYGIRLKPGSALNNLPEDFPHPSGHGNTNRNISSGGHNSSIGSGGSGIMNKRLKSCKSEGYDGNHANSFNIGESITVQQYLGDPSGAMEDFPDLDLEVDDMPEGMAENDLVTFRSLYKEHCEGLLETLANFQLGQVETLWRFFWRTGQGAALENTMDYEKILPKPKLMMLCRMKCVQDFVKEVDFNFYQKMVSILLPDVLRPIPSTMTQAIRNFAKTLENWLSSAMTGYPDEIIAIKVSIVSALAQTLRRYTSLNHLAQAARAVLQNQNQIAQMLSDLNRVDFHNVEEQASWVCGCEGDLVPNLEQDFKATLAQQRSLEQWATWLEGVVDRVLRPHLNTPRFVQAARHFLLKWSFYSSLIIRDLTLRSAASFGSFHLLRLLYDEYMFYLVEHRVAQVSGVVPIAVIGKKSQDPSFDSVGLVGNNSNSLSNVNGHGNNSNAVSSASSVGSPGESQGMIHNNNTGANFSASQIKSEFRRTKNFLTS